MEFAFCKLQSKVFDICVCWAFIQLKYHFASFPDSVAKNATYAIPNPRFFKNQKLHIPRLFSLVNRIQPLSTSWPWLFAFWPLLTLPQGTLTVDLPHLDCLTHLDLLSITYIYLTNSPYLDYQPPTWLPQVNLPRQLSHHLPHLGLLSITLPYFTYFLTPTLLDLHLTSSSSFP